MTRADFDAPLNTHTAMHSPLHSSLRAQSEHSSSIDVQYLPNNPYILTHHVRSDVSASPPPLLFWDRSDRLRSEENRARVEARALGSARERSAERNNLSCEQDRLARSAAHA
eukprot:6176426-Pleurochrysis_carterae.AAC.1